MMPIRWRLSCWIYPWGQELRMGFWRRLRWCVSRALGEGIPTMLRKWRSMRAHEFAANNAGANERGVEIDR